MTSRQEKCATQKSAVVKLPAREAWNTFPQPAGGASLTNTPTSAGGLQNWEQCVSSQALGLCCFVTVAYWLYNAPQK